MSAPPGEDARLQWFPNHYEAVDHIDEYTGFLKYDTRFKGLDLIVSRPRPEAGGWSLYAIPRPE